MNKEIENYKSELIELLEKLPNEKIYKLINLILKSGEINRSIYIAGNGGSAATASHFAVDLNKTVLGKHAKKRRKRLRAICLNDNVPLLTAWGNDSSYDDVFSEPLQNFGQKARFFAKSK